MKSPETAPNVAVLVLGEAHQLFHVLGPAAALAERGCAVTVFVSTAWHERLIAALAPEAKLTVTRLHRFGRWNDDAPIHAAPPRLVSLALNAHRFARFGVLHGDIVDGITHLTANPKRAMADLARAQVYIRDTYMPSVLAHRWQAVLGAVLAAWRAGNANRSAI